MDENNLNALSKLWEVYDLDDNKTYIPAKVTPMQLWKISQRIGDNDVIFGMNIFSQLRNIFDMGGEKTNIPSEVTLGRFWRMFNLYRNKDYITGNSNLSIRCRLIAWWCVLSRMTASSHYFGNLKQINALTLYHNKHGKFIKGKPDDIKDDKYFFYDDSYFVNLDEVRKFFKNIEKNHGFVPSLPKLLFAVEEKVGRNETSEKSKVKNDKRYKAVINEGDMWAVYFEEEHAHLKNIPRFQYIWRLLEKPNTKFFYKDFYQLVSGKRLEPNEKYKNMSADQLEEENLVKNIDKTDKLSENEKAEIKSLVKIKWKKLIRADSSEYSKVEDEWKHLKKLLLNEKGVKVIDGKNEPRLVFLNRYPEDVEGARVNIRTNISNALKVIKDKMPALYEHL